MNRHQDFVLRATLQYLEDRMNEHLRFHTVEPAETRAWAEMVALVESAADLMEACKIVTEELSNRTSASHAASLICRKAYLKFRKTYDATKNRTKNTNPTENPRTPDGERPAQHS